MKEFLLARKIKKYERNLRAHGAEPVYLEKLARLYVQISERETACQYYRQAIEVYYQDDSRLGQNNEFIIAVCWALLELDPLYVVAHQTLGQEYCSLGKFAEAAQLYKLFAVKLAKVGQYQDAILQYRNAFVLLPDDIPGRQECFVLLWKLRRKEEALVELQRIAEIAERMGKLAKAVECYQKALKIAPADPELQAELRRLLQVNRRSDNQLRLVVNNDV
jgi:tetratricopeptide (TPR) repeat protein